MSGSNPDQVWNQVPLGPVPATGLEQLLAVQDASPAAPLYRYALADLLHGGDGIFVDQPYGARGNRRAFSGALTVAAGANPTVTIPGADLTALAADLDGGVGQTVVLPLGGQSAVTASIGATFTGTGSGTNLTVTGVTGVIHPGAAAISGTGVLANTTIVSQTSGVPGGAGVYVTSLATTSSGATITAASTIVDVTVMLNRPLIPGGQLAGSGVTIGTKLGVQLSGVTGDIGTYVVAPAQRVAATTITETMGVLCTVGSVNTATSQIGLIGTVGMALNGMAFRANGSPTIAAAGTGVSPGDIYTLVDGTYDVPAQVTVMTTKVITVVINTAGFGGTDGNYTFIGTTPAATKFQFTGTITGGVLASITTLTVAGIYQKTPPDITAEPVTTTTTSGLTNATVTLVMGANSSQIQGQVSSSAIVTWPGGYSVVPADPIAATGPGTGVQFNMVSAGSNWATPSVITGTDNAPFINAAMDAARASGTPGGGGANRIALDVRLQFASHGDYLVASPLNFTNVSRLLVDGYRCNIYSVGAGKPVFDAMNAQSVRFQNLRIVGDAAFPPRWPFQIGRINSTDTAANMAFDQVLTNGTFIDAGFLYNLGSEDDYYALIVAFFSANFGMILDAGNSWNVVSDFVTVSLAANASVSFEGSNAGVISLTNNLSTGSAVWILGGANHAFGRNSYLFAHQFGVVIIGSSLAVTSGLELNGHVEGAREVFHFAPAAVRRNITPQANRLIYVDSAVLATEAIFGCDDAIAFGFVQNNLMIVAFAAAGTAYWSDPTQFEWSGTIYGGNQTTRWVAPRTAVGDLFFQLGNGLTQVLRYGLQAADDAVFAGDVLIDGVLQTYGAVSTSNGTVASLNVTAIGRYTYPDFPTVAIAAPASGVTATAIVIGMNWDGAWNPDTAGTGYSKGDVLTVVGGTSSLTAQMTVDEVDGSGGVTRVLGRRGGAYSVYPTNPASVSGGGGSGFKINLTLWSVKLGTASTQITAAGSGYTGRPSAMFSVPVSGAAPAKGSILMGTSAQLTTSGANVGSLAGGYGVQTGTSYTVANTDFTLTLNPSGPFTLTLPAAASFPNRILNLKLIAAQAVASASSNVVPLAGGAAGTAILTGTAGKYCTLQSDATAWQITAAN